MDGMGYHIFRPKNIRHFGSSFENRGIGCIDLGNHLQIQPLKPQDSPVMKNGSPSLKNSQSRWIGMLISPEISILNGKTSGNHHFHWGIPRWPSFIETTSPHRLGVIGRFQLGGSQGFLRAGGLARLDHSRRFGGIVMDFPSIKHENRNDQDYLIPPFTHGFTHFAMFDYG